jgi:acetate CoA/acetoacetate CoA-transferase alpha subunit
MNMKKVSAQEAVAAIKDGAVIMIGGFMSNGTSELLIDALIEKNVKDLTIIANDCGTPGTGIARLLAANVIKKMIASHIGLNPMAGQMMNEGKIEIQLVPQGTLAEQIRAGGAGLGGVLTPTGLGTEIERGKQVVEIDGKKFLLEKPLKADFAFIRASIADEKGNVFYKATTRNFNPLMAMAAETVIVAAEEIVPVGEIMPEAIATPGIFVDYLVGGEPHVN